MHSDFSLLDSNSRGTSSHSMPDVAPAVGAVSSAPLGGFCKQTLTDEEREQAITRAAALVEYLHALSQVHWALCNGEGDYFTHRAAYDQALADCHAARGIMERLIKGRSPAQIARMERERGLDLPACANE